MSQYVFPFAIAVLELGAALVFAYHRDWRWMIIWSGYALATFALVGAPK